MHSRDAMCLRMENVGAVEMTETNTEKFARIYAESFKEAYPRLDVDRCKFLIE